MMARFRRTTVGDVLLHAAALALVAFAGADHLVVPALAGPVASPTAAAPDPDDPPAGLDDYCRIRRDVRDDAGWARALARPARAAAVPPPALLSRPRPNPTTSPAVTASEHAPGLSRRTRAPGLAAC